jgi:hypothetical protein
MSEDWRIRREEKRGRFTVRLEIDDDGTESPTEWGSLDLILTRHRTRHGAFGDEEWSHNDGLACLPRTDPCWCDEDDPEWHERLQEEWEQLHRTDYIAVPVWHTPGYYDGGSLSLSGSDDPDAFVLIRCPHEPLQLVATLTSQWGGQTVGTTGSLATCSSTPSRTKMAMSRSRAGGGSETRRKRGQML